MMYFLQLLLFIAIYFVAGKIGLFVNGVGSQFPSTNFWPPAGIALAMLLLYGYRFLPAIFIGAFLVSLSSGIKMPVPIVVGIGSTLTPFVAAFILKRFIHFNNALERIKDVVGMSLIAFPISSAIIATAMTFGFLKGGFISSSMVSITWVKIWVSNFLSSFIVGAFIVVWVTRNKINWHNSKRNMEAVALASTLAILGFFMFSDVLDKTTPITYLVFIPIVWAALRFGVRETMTVIFVFCILAIWSISVGAGPTKINDINASLFYLESFMTVVATTAMILAAVVAEREELEEKKDTFISIASHELKTPLTSIKMVTQLLQRIHKKDGNDKELKYLENMEQQINKMTHLIRDMLDLSKIQAGRLTIEFHKFSIAEVINQAVESMQTIASRHTIVVEGEFAGDVKGDKERIEQVLVNLLSNAIKYSPDAEKIIVRGEVKDGDIGISIQDFGIGISKRKIGRIFERFYRVDKEARKSSGFGLGLFISSEIIKRHGGKIWVESEEGKGSTFYFTLPLV